MKAAGVESFMQAAGAALRGHTRTRREQNINQNTGLQRVRHRPAHRGAGGA